MSEQLKDDRRRKQRYPLELTLVYRTLGCGPQNQGSGRTRNISSRGLLFRADAWLHPGDEVELTIRWPVLLDQTARLNWLVRGCVVRHGTADCAVRIFSHEFRTRGSAIESSSRRIPTLRGCSKPPPPRSAGTAFRSI